MTGSDAAASGSDADETDSDAPTTSSDETGAAASGSGETDSDAKTGVSLSGKKHEGDNTLTYLLGIATDKFILCA